MKSLDGSFKRGKDEDDISSAAMLANLVGTLRRINCLH